MRTVVATFNCGGLPSICIITSLRHEDSNHRAVVLEPRGMEKLPHSCMMFAISRSLMCLNIRLISVVQNAEGINFIGEGFDCKHSSADFIERLKRLIIKELNKEMV